MTQTLKPTRPTRAVIPFGDVILGDGRRLVRQSDLVQPSGYRLYNWRTLDGMVVTSTIDPTQHGALLHVAVSYHDHDPSWVEIKHVRAAFYPASIDVMMMLPAEVDYINVHEHCFHLVQTPVAWAVQ